MGIGGPEVHTSRLRPYSLAGRNRKWLGNRGRHYERTASPFKWTFTRNDLHTLLAKIAANNWPPPHGRNTSS